jgi:hypothetical protein
MVLDEATLRAGRRLLRELLPWARAEARNPDRRTVSYSALFDAQKPYIKEANFHALVIHPAPLGGWHADLLLKGVPPGVANCMGSPVAEPFRTREAAEAGARLLLTAACHTARELATQPAGPAFLLYGHGLELSPAMIDAILSIMPGSYGRERAIEYIAQVVADVLPEGFTGRRFDALPYSQKTVLMSAIHIAAACGVLAYPPRRDASPSGHTEGEMSQARH